jgi:hypothetical protein
MQNYSIAMSAELGSYLKPFQEALDKMSRAMNNFVVINMRGITGTQPPEGSPPGTPATEPYGAAQYKQDMAKLAQDILVPLLKGLRDVIKPGNPQGNARGGIESGPDSGYLSLLHGTEAVIPLAGGSIPVQLSGTTGSAGLAGVLQQMQATFSAAVVAAEKANTINSINAANIPGKEQIKELPEALTAALETVLSGPAGLTEIMTAVKSQIAEDSRTQTGMLQQQIDNLVKLVDAMNDNVRYSERIANELA